LVAGEIPWRGAWSRSIGVETIGQLAATPLDTLQEMFGSSHGEFLYQASHGIDDRPVVTHWEPKSRSREVTFQRDTANWQELAKTLAALSREVADEVKEEGYRARTVAIKLRFSDFETHTREKTLSEPTGAVDTIRKAAFECLGRVELDRKVRLIGVRVGDLERVSGQQNRSIGKEGE
jgi:DNA polymerase IV